VDLVLVSFSAVTSAVIRDCGPGLSLGPVIPQSQGPGLDFNISRECTLHHVHVATSLHDEYDITSARFGWIRPKSLLGRRISEC
jgi:hypothetical protein